MDAAANKGDVHEGPTRGQRIGQLLMFVLVALFLSAAMYYALTLVRTSTYSTDRGFRVLDEAIGQFGNMQDSLASLLKLVPAIPPLPQCADPSPRKRAACVKKAFISVYQERLDVPEQIEERFEHKTFTSCTQTRREEFLLRPDEPGIGYTIFPCSAPEGDPAESYMLRGAMRRSIARFNSQQFFDETVFALQDGTVLAELTPQPERVERTGLSLQDADVPALMVSNASSLLMRRTEATKKEGAEKGEAATATLPSVFTESIAGQKFRVFVVGFRPDYPLYSLRDGERTQREQIVYVIGLKREKWATALAYALWPNGTFVITIGALIAVLLWPLMSLRLSVPQDPISRGEGLAVVSALILIPALLTICVVWAWSHRALQSWAKEGAENYARKIEQALLADLQTSSGLLDIYRERVYAERDLACNKTQGKCQMPPTLPLRPNDDGSGWLEVPPDAEGEPDCCGIYYLWTQGKPGALGNWSPLRTAIALDERGDKIGPRLTAFGAIPQRPTLNLADRAYFDVIKRGNGWRVPASELWSNPPERGIVAQRLFSRADAARTLQVALSLCAPGEAFCGIVTGDSRVHALTAPIAPPLFRFAVIDRDTGTVLFHSDDSRSLAENFFTETEHDPELHAALRVNRPTHFSGRYLGDPHRFYFRPLQGVPWSVVVFYSKKTLGDLPLQAGVAALTAHASVTLLVLLIVGVLLFSESRWARRGLAYIWPQWRHRRLYASLGWALWALSLVTALLAFAVMRENYGLGAGAVAIVVVVGVVWRWRARRVTTERTPEMSVRSYERAYIRCIVGVLFFVAVLPAAWLALSYHDAQVHGLLREATQQSVIDVERRHALIGHDLMRWVPNAQARLARYPDAWSVTEVSVPGYDFANGRWTLNVFHTMPWANVDGPAALGPWRQQAWRAAAQTSAQLRRINLLNFRAVAACSDVSSNECFRVSASDSHPIEIATPMVLSRDGGRAANQRASTPLLLAGIIVFGVSFWLAALVARRFFGVGLPFAARYLPVLSVGDEVKGSVLLYRPMKASAEQTRLPAARLREVLASIPAHNILDLDCVPMDQPLLTREGDFWLKNFDIALLSVARRQYVLAQLEQALAMPGVGLYITSEKMPSQWLFRSDIYPETMRDERLDLQEELRWDNVFTKLSMIDLRRGEEATDRRIVLVPALRDARLTLDALAKEHGDVLTDKDRADFLAVQAEAHYHRVWKLCTRDERLLLHQLSTGRYANPANQPVIERLIRAGLVTLDPWPRPSDSGFARYVRTAETKQDFTEWQRAASSSAWRSVKTPLLIVLLLVVGWLIWTAGDYVQTFSAILVAAVALLGQFGQVVNLVRGSVGQKS